MKVQIGDLVVHVDTMEELDAVVRRYGKGPVPSAASVTGNGSGAGSSATVPSGRSPVVHENIKAPATFYGGGSLVKSSSKREALLKLYKNLKVSTHKELLKFLASRGAEGADADDIRVAFGLSEKKKLGGFTSAIRRSAPHYGLEGDDVMVVDYQGIVGATRIQIYKIGPEMLEMMKELGYVE